MEKSIVFVYFYPKRDLPKNHTMQILVLLSFLKGIYRNASFKV